MGDISNCLVYKVFKRGTNILLDMENVESLIRLVVDRASQRLPPFTVRGISNEKFEKKMSELEDYLQQYA